MYSAEEYIRDRGKHQKVRGSLSLFTRTSFQHIAGTAIDERIETAATVELKVGNYETNISVEFPKQLRVTDPFAHYIV